MANANAETERLVAWCEAQIPLQQEKMQRAQQVVTIYATPTTQGAVVGPDSEEAQFRSECANTFWRLADLLRRQAAALAARTREVEEMREALREARAYLPDFAPEACVVECRHPSCERRRVELRDVREQIIRALAAQEGTR